MQFKFLLSIIFITSFTLCCVAAGPHPPPTGGPACWPPPCIPIDGGISLLIAAGAIYGGKKLYSKQKKQKSL
jgi:hypothetical protein